MGCLLNWTVLLEANKQVESEAKCQNDKINTKTSSLFTFINLPNWEKNWDGKILRFGIFKYYIRS